MIKKIIIIISFILFSNICFADDAVVIGPPVAAGANPCAAWYAESVLAWNGQHDSGEEFG